MYDYKETLNLPKTKFPMRANLPKNEPKMIEFWQEIGAYEKMVNKGENQEKFVLHDGPPYANGHIHLGTAMNKILKDIIIKAKNLNDKKAEYVPGWDCHGLPIELKVEQETGGREKGLSVLEVRQRCRSYALKYLDIQRNEFKRLGVLGNWENPYITMHPAYEAATASELYNFIEKGSVLRNKKPIHWCFSCETALAEAEVEYYSRVSPSIFVKFSVIDQKIHSLFSGANGLNVYVLIWTTTPWTLPSNMAIAVHPDYQYLLVQDGRDCYLIAEKLFQQLAEQFGWKQGDILGRCLGQELEGLKAEHPFYDRISSLVLADYVTLETGTGCVHTAPGHGQEDYVTGLRYGLPVYSPLNDQGRFLTEVEFFAELNVFEADSKVIEKLQESNKLMAQEKITHSYPHCWRCKKPVIFRATTQWFISMENNQLRDKSLHAIDTEVSWIPPWGKQRIRNMVEHRPDWCLSRQRSWGVPIVALICKQCNEAYCDPQWAQAVINRFQTHERGADYWFEADLQEIMPQGLICSNCGQSNWSKETDILDVWFDSGTSFAAVLEQRPECTFPADMYLEGSDQHRGWFHSSLLAAVGTRDRAPYRSVLTHGFVVDWQSRKMSKSLGNVIAPQDIIKKYGAEILRMWVASENYQEDMRISEDILKQLVDNYRKIRNTCRYILGNLADFNYPKHSVAYPDMQPLDRYILSVIKDRYTAMKRAYENYELHRIFHTLHNACVNDLSSFYLDILKDRLYVQAFNSPQRRSAQTALLHILLLLLDIMAPILSFTAEEIYQYLPQKLRQDSPTVFGWKGLSLNQVISESEKSLWQFLTKVRNEVTKAIEPERRKGTIGLSLDAQIKLCADDSLLQELQKAKEHLQEFFIVSRVELKPYFKASEHAFHSQEIPGLGIEVDQAPGEKCARCWNISQKLGKDPYHPQACPRCTDILYKFQDQEMNK